MHTLKLIFAIIALLIILVIAGLIFVSKKEQPPQDDGMRVFKFYSDEFFYIYSGQNEEEAREALFEDIGVFEILKTEEIPESEWDVKDIRMYEDNNFDSEPHRISIRDVLSDKEPVLLCRGIDLITILKNNHL